MQVCFLPEDLFSQLYF